MTTPLPDRFKADWADTEPPKNIAFLNSNLVKEAIVDTESPLPLYLYSMNPSSRNMAVFFVLGLWSLETQAQEEIVRAAQYVQSHVRDKSIAPVILAIPPGDLENQSCILFGNNPEALSLDLWLRDRDVSAIDRLELCASIARAIHRLHENGIANLPIHPRVIHVDDDGSVTVYPVGDLYENANKGESEQGVGTFCEAVDSDLHKLFEVSLEMFGVTSPESCENPELRQVLKRLGQDDPNLAYTAVGDVVSDFQKLIICSPIAWIHTTSLARAAYQARRHRKLTGGVAALVAVVFVLLSALIFVSVQQRSAMLLATSKIAEVEAERDERIAIAYQLLSSIDATARHRFDSGNIAGSLSVLDALNERMNLYAASEPAVAQDVAKVVASGRLRILQTDRLGEDSRRDLIFHTVTGARGASIWEWLLEQSEGIREELQLASVDVDLLHIDLDHEH